MEIRKIKANGTEYEFINESRWTRSGFAHDTRLFKNGCFVAEHSCYYYNRTWECYRFQTVMRCAVNELIEQKKENLKRIFKENNGYKKLTAKRAEELEKIFEKDKTLKEYDAVKECLNYENMAEVKNYY